MANTRQTRTRLFFTIIATGLALVPLYSLACTPMANRLAYFTPAHDGANILVPGTPKVSIEHISRGGDRPDSCSDIGRIMLSITDTPGAYAYRFVVIEGKSPSDGFNDQVVVGYRLNDKHMFQFSWHEPGIAVPLDFKVRVTAYSRAGNEGSFLILHIRDEGRPKYKHSGDQGR